MSDDTDTIEQEIDKYTERLRRLAWYQMYLICPTLIVAAIIAGYTFFYDRTIWNGLVIAICVGASIGNYFGARRTFVRIVQYKIGFTDEP